MAGRPRRRARREREARGNPTEAESWPDSIGLLERWWGATRNPVVFTYKDKWAFIDAQTPGSVEVILGDEGEDAKFKFGSREEAIAAVRDWSDFLAEGDY